MPCSGYVPLAQKKNDKNSTRACARSVNEQFVSILTSQPTILRVRGTGPFTAAVVHQCKGDSIHHFLVQSRHHGWEGIGGYVATFLLATVVILMVTMALLVVVFLAS
ncbi:hypothetical protein MTO96_048499, partial [Rhipicephalus appendiculatus]